MKRIFLIASLLLGAVRFAHAEDIKLGYVDLQRAVGETEDGRKAKGDLKRLLDTKQKEIDEQQEEIKKAMDDLEKKRTLLPADKVKEKEGDLQNRIQKVQQAYLRNQQDLQAKEQEAMAKIIDRMQRIVAKLASAENFTMVLERNQAGLIYAKPPLDLTNDLIRRYNAGEEANAPAAKKAAASPAAPKAAKK